MAGSVVYASVFAAALASLASLRTRLLVFDTDVADLTDTVSDPVELLFAVQLGGGTDIAPALAACEALVERPRDTVLVLLSDLFDNGDRRATLAHLSRLRRAGVTLVCLTTLSDEGAEAFSRDMAAKVAALDIPVFACTPDRFPDLMAAALERRDLGLWAGEAGLVTRS